MALFKLHVPILDDIKAKGLKPALLAKVDDAVTRFTAGLSIGDIRGVLRGDPAPRPNPRVKPHADGFWFHMRPTYYHNLVTPLYPEFRLGWLSLYFMVFETLTGIFLMIFYTPSPLVAFENMLNILSNVPLGLFMRDLHKFGAEMMVAVVSLHMLRTVLTGNYKKPRQFTWFTGVVLLLVTLILSFSGYLLPWDQLSLWAVTIGASMVEAVPTPWPLNIFGEQVLGDPSFVGTWINNIARGGPQFNADGLLRWYLLHILALPLIGFVFIGVHYYKVVIHGHSLPPEAEKVGEDTAKRVPMDQRTYFMPDIITRELFYVALVTFVCVFAVTLGGFHASLEPHADPLVTPLHTTAPWYFLWVQGMLKLGDKVFWGLIAPGIIFSLLFVLGYIEVGPSRRYADRRIGLSVCMVALVALSVTTFMGTPWYAVSSSPDQEVVAALVPQTHPGLLRETPFEKLIVDDYNAADWQSAPNPEMKALLREYEDELEIARQKRDAITGKPIMPDAEGLMIVEDWQAGLKKITLRINWTKSDGTPGTFSQDVYLHKDSNYGE
ncbi:MAG: cytochrome bc complex cytochrome b subunit [Chloroflexi bacterium]|nr:cytochrome bc complex cytochrome b subunit [Chloroflexota bacterium]